MRPDVACFQEVWQDANTANTAAWIVEQLPGLGYHLAFHGAPFDPQLWPDPSMRFGSAVLSRWPIEPSTYHRLPIDDRNVGDGFVASVPWELVHVRSAGLDVFSCHLAPAPTHGLHRRVQVLAIDEIVRRARGDLDAVPPPGRQRNAMPIILCGDFNAEPDSDEIRFLCSLTPLDGRTAFYQDAWRVAGDGPGYTQDWRTNALAESMNPPQSSSVSPKVAKPATCCDTDSVEDSNATAGVRLSASQQVAAGRHLR
ncbi:MAG: endonuclease/exonuclease/phosphatase family protein [Ilumatobacteraceae bacterium]